MYKNKFNVLTWNFNRDELEYYDVLPYFRDCYNKCIEYSKKNKSDNNSDWWKVPKTLDEFKEFIEQKSQHQFWSRCEYEMICHGWPVHKNEYKLDVHEQIMMNIDVIAEILYNEFEVIIIRNKKQYYFNGTMVSWEEIPIDIRKKDYNYYFDNNGNDCFPIIQEI